MLPRILWYCYELLKNERLKPNELKRLQSKRLRAILKHAYHNVPLYHKKFKFAGIKPENVKSPENLSKLPFTTKQEIRNGIPNESIAKGYLLKDCIRVSTSGTSGGPMPVYYDKRYLDYCMANWRFRRPMAIGVKPWEKTLLIEYSMPQFNRQGEFSDEGGYKAKTKSRDRAALGSIVYLLRNRRRKVYIWYTAENVLAEIIRFKPKLIRGTPSYLRLVAEAMVDEGIENLGSTVVRTEGEVTDEVTRKYLESVFKCEVFDEYSTWDFGIGAWECRKKEGYHIDADQLIMEVVRGNEQAASGERGEIVVTALLNYAMPLIRYRVGDVGIFHEETCSCGRSLPMLKSIEGRLVDCFTLSNGRKVTPKLIMNAIQGTHGVTRYQVVQESVNKVTIELMRRENDPEVSVDELIFRCRNVLGDDVEIEVFTGDRRNLKAKFRPVISRLTVSGEPRWVKPRARS